MILLDIIVYNSIDKDYLGTKIVFIISAVLIGLSFLINYYAKWIEERNIYNEKILNYLKASYFIMQIIGALLCFALLFDRFQWGYLK